MEEGGACTWSRSRHHIPERPRWSHSVSRVSSKHSISVSRVMILCLGVQLTYSSTFRIGFYFIFLNGSLERRKDGRGLADCLLAIVLHICFFPIPVRLSVALCFLRILKCMNSRVYSSNWQKVSIYYCCRLLTQGKTEEDDRTALSLRPLSSLRRLHKYPVPTVTTIQPNTGPHIKSGTLHRATLY